MILLLLMLMPAMRRFRRLPRQAVFQREPMAAASAACADSAAMLPPDMVCCTPASAI